MRLVGVLFFLLCACKPASKNQAQSDNQLQKVVRQEVGENVSITKNDGNSFALVVAHQDQSIHYAVIRLSDYKVVVKNKVRGSVKWSGNLQLTEFRTPGIVRKDDKPEDHSKVIDLSKYFSQKD